jgi:Rad3-related DNA helicase
MTDRELLESAAKAAEMPKGSVMGSGDYLYEKNGVAVYWNPLTDDGDALRLAVKCHLAVCVYVEGRTEVITVGEDVFCEYHADHSGSPLAATRRAIVRAAAVIGRNA